ncbi:M23 family metallopeptidase [Shimazuella kribbensis]|uniref:M23 family metallopeptidase n=1 Tax=Shimazuella kribbensis TaxID=139808 RepID=UPI000419B215|nr:M23 family metallopeptidase [Shimazuella kribbensis]
MKKWNYSFLSFLLFLSCFTIFPSTPKTTYAAPTFQMPFPCDQTWNGETRKKHNPKLAIDFTRKNGHGDPVVASASGKIKKIGDLGNKSFGKFVYIDHGNGWETRHAHLSKITVKKGQLIEIGQQIGNVGNSGNSTASHLHYEQKHNGEVQPIYFGSSKAYYYGKKEYKSNNNCTKKQHTGTVKTENGKK